MYAAKENGRNQYQIFSEEHAEGDGGAVDRWSMRCVMRWPMDELSLHYQPQISLTTGAVTGMEALLRWTHPKLGRSRRRSSFRWRKRPG